MRLRAVLLVTFAIALTGCGGDDETITQPNTPSVAASTTTAMTPTPSPPPTQPPSPSPTTVPGTVVTTAGSEFGEMLFDDSGQAIYLFDAEQAGTPECYDECAAAWPPVLTEGEPVAAGGVVPAQLGTTSRTDGMTQVTYAGHPLYYYAHEGKNQVLCHNVRDFGGLWLVVTPSGAPAP